MEENIIKTTLQEETCSCSSAITKDKINHCCIDFEGFIFQLQIPFTLALSLAL
jgi:uncharacterized protein YecA (UPF0149 family)